MTSELQRRWTLREWNENIVPMFKDEIAAIQKAIEVKGSSGERFLVAIAGPPASGKSTLAHHLVRQLGETAVLVPMDGFHLDNNLLRKAGTLSRKGAPWTFDGDGFASLVSRIASGCPHVAFPLFDRERDVAIAGAGMVRESHSTIVFEGNYLLLDEAPWSDVINKYDLTIMLQPTMATLEKRLVQRWLDHGFEETGARAKALENDLPNARLIQRGSRRADLTF